MASAAACYRDVPCSAAGQGAHPWISARRSNVRIHFRNVEVGGSSPLTSTHEFPGIILLRSHDRPHHGSPPGYSRLHRARGGEARRRSSRNRSLPIGTAHGPPAWRRYVLMFKPATPRPSRSPRLAVGPTVMCCTPVESRLGLRTLLWVNLSPATTKGPPLRHE